MYVKKLQQKQFRNLATREINFSKAVTLIIGDNGQGKTNLLESIYFLVKGNSFRTPKVHHLIHNSCVEGSLSAEISHRNLNHKVQVNFKNGKKQILINGKKASSAALLKKFPSVLFSPESLAAIKEGPELRRSLVDELLVSHQPENAILLSDFQKCLKSRNKVLKDYKQEKIAKSEMIDVLESLDGSYLPLGAKLAWKRIQALNELSADLSEATKEILELENVDIAVDYLCSSQSAINWDHKQVYYALLSRKEELRQFEMDSGMTLFGPHRHDIQFLFDKVDSRYYCSQGQQRALILAFKMAQIMYHYKAHQDYPLLMLDDVLSELDPKKRSNLIAFLKRLESQIILTTTDLNFSKDFAREDVEVFKVCRGEVTKDG